MVLPAILYLLLFLLLIYKTNFFGLFADDKITPGVLTLIFFIKSLAIPTFYIVYKNVYGGIEKFDAGIFYNDARAINNLAWINLGEYVKVVLGLQDDSPGSYFYTHGTINTLNWDNGKLKDFFYNDNRIVIRLHSILHFIAFGSYAVHALFTCFISYVGTFYLYKTFKEFFKENEIWLIFILCLFPTLWFYTGAVLKEGLVLFVLGCSIYQIKKITQKKFPIRALPGFVFLLFISLLLKPYLLCFALFCFSLFFFLQHSVKIKYKVICFFMVVAIVVISVNVCFIYFKNRGLKEMALAQQRIFSDASRGGIFLNNAVILVRLNDDTTLVFKKPGSNTYTIKKNIPYIFWEHNHAGDTLFCRANQDTLAQYDLIYRVKKGGSNIDLAVYSNNNLSLVIPALHYSLFFPLFYNANGPLQAVASFENLLIIISLFILFYGLIVSKKDRLLPLTLIFFALSLCILIGITTPNSGAIFRYRSPVVIFILIAALYYSKPFKVNFIKRLN